MIYDLFDPKSEGRKNIRRVRAMHTLARKRATKTVGERSLLLLLSPSLSSSHPSPTLLPPFLNLVLMVPYLLPPFSFPPSSLLQFSATPGCGVPLGQYDLNLVLMAFSSLVVYLIECQFGIKFSKKETNDYFHLWRFLGHMLGISDDLNIARDYETAEGLRTEFVQRLDFFSGRRLAGNTGGRSGEKKILASRASIQLVRSTINGFGNFTFASRDLYLVLLFSPKKILGDKSPVDAEWTGVAPPPPAYMKKILARWKKYKNGILGNFLNFVVVTLVHWQLTRPRVAYYMEVLASWMPQKLKP
jgi:hypothetical protein